MSHVIKPHWPAPRTVHAMTTLRHTWRDDKSQLKSILTLPSDPIWLKQTHSIIALPATQAHLFHEGDASFTNEHEQVCVILTADCLPIFLCNEAGTQVAAIHAGWRGLANGVIESTVTQLSSDSSWMAWLGPAIGPTKFEVGEDVYHAFTDHDSEALTAFTPLPNKKWMANLYQLATLRLQRLGITRIYGGEYCTHTQEDLFFSYRRDQGNTGRMASVIWLSFP